jgi:uncharacterized cupredoxin-like copper-binding protein
VDAVRALSRIAIAALAGGVVAAGGYGVDALANAKGDDDAVLGPGLVTVEVPIEHSIFLADDLRVYEGTMVRFVVVNRDPINHELVIGDEAVHRRHENGTERAHPPVPGEVSVGPNETGLTTYTFDEPGTVEFMCHLPRHVEFGMVGDIEVVRQPS